MLTAFFYTSVPPCSYTNQSFRLPLASVQNPVISRHTSLASQAAGGKCRVSQAWKAGLYGACRCGSSSEWCVPWLQSPDGLFVAELCSSLTRKRRACSPPLIANDKCRFSCMSLSARTINAVFNPCAYRTLSTCGSRHFRRRLTNRRPHLDLWIIGHFDVRCAWALLAA